MKLADSQIIRLLKQILAATSGGAGAAWGAITGTLSAQTDLQSALDAKQASLGFTAVPNTRTVNGHALSGNITVSKADVGLTNADDTSDANKPVSTAQATAIAAKVSDTAYDATSWDGVTTVAPSKNAVRDKIEAVVASIPTAPNKRVTGSAAFAGADAGSAVVSGIIASVARNGAGEYLAVFTATQEGIPYLLSVTAGTLSGGSAPFIASVSNKTDTDFSVDTFEYNLVSIVRSDAPLINILVFQ